MTNIDQDKSARNRLLALAERVECYKPSGHFDLDREDKRELNEAIAAAIGMPLTVKVGILGDERMVPSRLPAFVTSLDAAMHVVPAGMFPQILCQIPKAIILEMQKISWRVKGESGDCATPVLALCGAALRARAGQMQ